MVPYNINGNLKIPYQDTAIYLLFEKTGLAHGRD